MRAGVHVFAQRDPSLDEPRATPFQRDGAGLSCRKDDEQTS